jgi:hypothetical protein
LFHANLCAPHHAAMSNQTFHSSSLARHNVQMETDCDFIPRASGIICQYACGNCINLHLSFQIKFKASVSDAFFFLAFVYNIKFLDLWMRWSLCLPVYSGWHSHGTSLIKRRMQKSPSVKKRVAGFSFIAIWHALTCTH